MGYQSSEPTWAQRCIFWLSIVCIRKSTWTGHYSSSSDDAWPIVHGYISNVHLIQQFALILSTSIGYIIKRHQPKRRLESGVWSLTYGYASGIVMEPSKYIPLHKVAISKVAKLVKIYSTQKHCGQYRIDVMGTCVSSAHQSPTLDSVKFDVPSEKPSINSTKETFWFVTTWPSMCWWYIPMHSSTCWEMQWSLHIVWRIVSTFVPAELLLTFCVYLVWRLWV